MSMVDTGTLRWWKSSRSNSSGGQCVEVATTGTTWFVRDSKNPTGSVLAVSSAAWARFLSTVA
jgi:uncharacterized protein DUF397